jgi:Transposase
MSVHSAGTDIFPLDEQWGIRGHLYSDGLTKQMVWISGVLPYEQCQQAFERLAERPMPKSSIWRESQRHGERLRIYVEQQQEQVSLERVTIPDSRYDHEQRKGLSMDGGMVNIREEGWRELKVGATFEIEMRLERNPQTQELDEMAHAVDTAYTAVLGSKDEFTPALSALAVAHDLPTARERVVVSDGAAWIWNVAEDVCPDARQIVDWFHAVQHLVQAAQALYPDESLLSQRMAWLRTHKEHLYMGRIHIIIAALCKCQREDLAGYFEQHQRRMQYLEFREEGFPIGSGTIESGVKQFKQRLCGTGMRWSRTHAQRMLVIRSAVLGHDFDALWAAA